MSQAAGATGRVYDLGFRRYEGPRGGRRRAMLAVYKDGLRAATGLGRGGRAKIVPWLAVGAALVPAHRDGARRRRGEPARPRLRRRERPPLARQLLRPRGRSSCSSSPRRSAPSSSAPTAGTGRSASTSSGRSRRSTTRSRAGRRLLTVLVAAAWLPQLVLLAGLVLGAPDPGHYFAEHWLDVPRFLLAGLALAAWTGTAATLVSAFTTRRAYAAAFLVGVFIVSAAVVGGVTDAVSLGCGPLARAAQPPGRAALRERPRLRRQGDRRARPPARRSRPRSRSAGTCSPSPAMALVALRRYRRLAA